MAVISNHRSLSPLQDQGITGCQMVRMARYSGGGNVVSRDFACLWDSMGEDRSSCPSKARSRIGGESCGRTLKRCSLHWMSSSRSSYPAIMLHASQSYAVSYTFHLSILLWVFTVYPLSSSLPLQLVSFQMLAVMLGSASLESVKERCKLNSSVSCLLGTSGHGNVGRLCEVIAGGDL